MPATLTRFWLSLLLGSSALVVTGCGGLAKSGKTSITQGNWSLAATSSDSGVGTFQMGGNLTQSGDALSASMSVSGSLCFDVSQPVPMTGTVKDKQVTLTSGDVNGQVFSVVATETSGSAMNGTYTITGGCGSGDHGSVIANAVPSITGTWHGSVIGAGGSEVSLSIALTQARNASADGTFALTGNLTYTGSTCSVNGTVNAALIAGSYILMNGTTNETDGSTGSLAYDNTLLDDSRNPKSMTGTYLVDFGLCAGDVQTLTLSRQ